MNRDQCFRYMAMVLALRAVSLFYRPMYPGPAYPLALRRCNPTFLDAANRSFTSFGPPLLHTHSPFESDSVEFQSHHQERLHQRSWSLSFSVGHCQRFRSERNDALHSM